ncbi:MAG: hypothetical protein KAY37_08270 [Phycisphaerae bacterium]|nr:hypothetical protein [Phycisphaerae bacterium]
MEKPPEHWRSTARAETQPPAEREEASLAQLCGDDDCDIADALSTGVVEAEASIDLQDDAWYTLMVSAACADFARSIPQPSDTFIIQRWPHQKDLRKLMDVLCRDAWPPSAQPRDIEQAIHVAQAAIWIVAGNARQIVLAVLAAAACGGCVSMSRTSGAC